MKYFVVSDIHGFFSPMATALKKAGFRRNNKNHILIVCGDVFDRGDFAEFTYNYLSTLPKNRCILIRGNHEDLYLDLLEKDFPDSYDMSNGTVGTFCQFAMCLEKELCTDYSKLAGYEEFLSKNEAYNVFCKSEFVRKRQLWKYIKSKVLEHPATAWLKSDRWINYYELDKYIFTHSFIPLHNIKNIPIYGHFDYANYLKYFDDWRTQATPKEWYEARWGCPWKQFKDGLFNEEIKNNKILVCGHWHVSDFHKNFNNVENTYSTYIGKNLIGLDACTALSETCNVLVIEK